MADVLTQAQIDEMLKNVAAGAVPEVTQKEEEKVKEYDFRAPKKFTKEADRKSTRLNSSHLRIGVGGVWV